MNKAYIFFIVILLIAGCKGTGKEYNPSITGEQIYSGKDGLIMEFLKDAPPGTAFDLSVIPIGLNLYNKGAFDINEGYLSIMLEKDYMELNTGSLRSINGKTSLQDSSKIGFELKGKQINLPNGDRDVITFTANTQELGERDRQSQLHDSFISITGCYGYKTTAAATVCIDSALFGLKKMEKTCEIKDVNLNSQGAPIAVTKIQSEMVPDSEDPAIVKPRFVITIKNIGNGEAVKRDRVRDACSSEAIGYKDWSKINAKVYLGGVSDDKLLKCDVAIENDGVVRLQNKEDTIRCSYEAGFDDSKGTFSTPIYVILEYGYSTTISKQIRIIKA